MSKPWLSVIMPTYNGAAYLGSALESLVAQQEEDFDVVAVDDGSTDTTLTILREYSKRLPMTIVEREHEGNWVANTNLGMRSARGTYLCWLHQDDAWCDNRLAELKRLTAKWPDASLLLHPCWFIDAAGNRVGRWRCPLPRRTTCLESRDVLGHLLIQDFVTSSAPTFKAEAALKVGGMDERLWYVGDWDLWMKMVRLGRTIYHPVPLTSFRIHGASQTLTRTENMDDLRHQYTLVLARHLQEWEACERERYRTARIACFSADVNLALMRLVAGRRVEWFRLSRDFLRLGPVGWHRYLRDSRILERIMSRIRAGVATGALRNGGCPRRADRTPPIDVEEVLGKRASLDGATDGSRDEATPSEKSTGVDSEHIATRANV
jgi:GT2 family glycosyltransferase